MQIIFQDPYSSLNPRMTVEEIVGEALTVHGIAKGQERRRVVEQLLDKVGLSARHVGRYPHEFSGGQRQRIGIARALAVEPEFIVCDEPVSALDVSIQAQILNLLMDLQQELGLTYLFIAHDLSVVEHISDRVAVMYLGKIVEVAPVGHALRAPAPPLHARAPLGDPDPRPARTSARGSSSRATSPRPSIHRPGCNFHTRCVYAEERCKREIPLLREVGGEHRVACHLVDVATGELVKDGKVVPATPVRRLNVVASKPAAPVVAPAAAEPTTPPTAPQPTPGAAPPSSSVN